jgi:hypothetical protein
LMYSWKSRSPCVVLAWKLGASVPSLIRGCSIDEAYERRKSGVSDDRAGALLASLEAGAKLRKRALEADMTGLQQSEAVCCE